jgi:hypothetical protein
VSLRWVAAASRLVAVVWAIALAAFLAPVDEEVRARVRPEPSAQAAPTTEPPAAAPRAQEVAPRAVVAADLRSGAALLEGGGAFPALTASYDGLHSFAAYAAAMQTLGARFFVVRDRRIVGEIDVMSGAIEAASADGAFSPRARDYSGEPALAGPARRVRSRFGGDAAVRMLVPRALDAGLFGSIARALAERGRDHRDYAELIGHYERPAGGALRLRLEEGVHLDGRRERVDLVFDLDAIARLGHSGPAA